MHVIVVGCGRVGSELADELDRTGHSVAVVDRDPGAFHRLPEGFGGRTVTGVGFDRDALLAAGIEEAGALAAVTSGDNSNIVVARVAREAFAVARVVARIYDPERAAIYERLGIPAVATVEWTTRRVLQRVLPDAGTVEWSDPSDELCVVERALPTAWAGRPLDELEVTGLSRVVGITRTGRGLLPDAVQAGQEGDVVWLAVATDRVDELDAHLAGTTMEG